MSIIKVKVVLNKCNGGFCLSQQALELYAKRKGIKITKYKWTGTVKNPVYIKCQKDDQTTKYFYSYIDSQEEINKKNDLKIFTMDDIERNDPDLIYVVETLKEKANGKYSDLSVENVNIFINDYDGYEQVTGAE